MKNKENISEIEVLESSPIVNLIITSNVGEVLYLSQVGGESLVNVLREVSNISDYPVYKQEFQLDDVGQEIYYTGDKVYFQSIVGLFSSVAWSTANGLKKFTSREGLVFSLVVTY